MKVTTKIEELHGLGFDVFVLATPAEVLTHRTRLENCPVTFELVTAEETLHGFPVHLLAVKRTSPTLKQILAAKGEL